MVSDSRRISLSMFNTLLPSELVERLAVPYKLDRDNSIKLSGPLVFFTLLRGLLYSQQAALRLMAISFEEFTGVSLDHSSLSKRLSTIDVAYFHDIYEHLAKLQKSKINPRSPGALSVHKIDATIVSLSAKLCSFGIKQRANQTGMHCSLIKSVFSLEDNVPRFLHLCSERKETSDSKAIGETIIREYQAGQLWVFDRGCTDRNVFLSIHNKGAFFLTRHHRQGLEVVRSVYTAEDASAPTHVPEPGGADFVVSNVQECVFMGSERRRCKKYAHMHLAVVRGYRYDRRTGKGWTELNLMTDLPISADGTKIGPYTYHELGQTYRDRWEIETFFKKIKGHLSFDHLLNRSENGIRITIYMTLIAAMMMIWAKDVLRLKQGWNIVKFVLEINSREWIELTIRHHRPYLLQPGRGG